MNTIQLDKNYRIVSRDQGDDGLGFYNDDLAEIVNRVLKLKTEGKINEKEAKLILKIFISKNLEKEFEASLDSMFKGSDTDSKKSNMLFFRFLNKSYV